MKLTPLAIADVVLIEPQVFGDERGCFFESFNQDRLDAQLGRRIRFVQDNHSCSRAGVLRGLHYQILHPQAKLVRVVAGEAYDVAVDLRRGSPTFGRWTGAYLSARNRHQLWIPEGFAHGFLALSDDTECLYKATDYYAPEHERCVRWDDPQLKVDWPLQGQSPILSVKDRQGVALARADTYA
ncbi:dTDP-4-dehydrorhamnose 3,5-epimerase [Bordetella bronchiseptica]|uniref:dTDP-4-dehydrorhamnose 3,5-epimerase n=1 Tax=Bordetella bronchiseptica TaxID=518 RepID=UPI000444E3E8|nr:dTDP-4-dehydrorhamnose 3,5-epimerase [Bordetella bronchiseptica]AWP82722.1 dTDP-4-dehydrorhamnose 3,5-epimerase [Bordetella bronchiseptica]AWQ08290.1 dTDP-4-dehydrorhamnose 3,5-epimerase [Bordetella bronchiseptica]AXT91327.1 dTDP-4-dehydrorhamnose 3,5-epimerase [Bordetella bronchiseptica]KDB81678.1 dTDP-4-dehydrorhamnose 3,5-epimerase [Bordetella bronchiseptica CARE970018BB]KDC98833.1 dTDP-4-dehydrorhamnose 3,5-epimerase [Bordetella bronchiseptica MBORD670]